MSDHIESTTPFPYTFPIFLVGFMGSGKTTIGGKLARRIGYEFQDLDCLIESRAGKTIKQIFADSGEQHFRLAERQALESFRGMTRTVVSLGGGAYVAEENRGILREIGKTVWIDCPLDLCLARLPQDQSRPLLGSHTQMEDLMAARRPAYEQADFTIHSAYGLSPGRAARKIIEMIVAAMPIEVQPEQS